MSSIELKQDQVSNQNPQVPRYVSSVETRCGQRAAGAVGKESWVAVPGKTVWSEMHCTYTKAPKEICVRAVKLDIKVTRKTFRRKDEKCKQISMPPFDPDKMGNCSGFYISEGSSCVLQTQKLINEDLGDSVTSDLLFSASTGQVIAVNVCCNTIQAPGKSSLNPLCVFRMKGNYVPIPLSFVGGTFTDSMLCLSRACLPETHVDV